MSESVAVIGYDFFNSRFGRGLIASSASGICEAAFSDSSHAELIRELQQHYPDAQLEHQPGHFAGLCRQMFSAEDPACELDMHGSQFQVKVWSELCRVPTGQTVSYQQLAQRLGMPRAVRAVANAVAKNRIALLVPCHRVIRSDGSLGGYRWGPARKSAILEWEGSLSAVEELAH